MSDPKIYKLKLTEEELDLIIECMSEIAIDRGPLDDQTPENHLYMNLSAAKMILDGEGSKLLVRYPDHLEYDRPTAITRLIQHYTFCSCGDCEVGGEWRSRP